MEAAAKPRFGGWGARFAALLLLLCISLVLQGGQSATRPEPVHRAGRQGRGSQVETSQKSSTSEDSWTASLDDPQAGEPAPSNPNYPEALPGASPGISNVQAFADRLWDKYQKRLRSPAASGSTLVHKCFEGDHCNGWADRLYGITAVFYYALLTDSQFDIQNVWPNDLADVYPLIAQRRPKYKQQDVEEMDLFKERAKMRFLLDHDLKAGVQRQPVHYIRCNQYRWYYLKENPHLTEAVEFYGLHQLTTFDMFRVVMELFFSERNPKLQQLIDSRIGEMEEEDAALKVGVQIRTGGDGWPDPPRHPTTAALQFADQALSVCGQKARAKCSIFLTSDSMTAQGLFLEYIKQQAPDVHVVLTEGAPVHLDMRFDSSNEVLLYKSYLDWELLRHMDRLVISRSGFGETAAWASNILTTRVASEISLEFITYDGTVGFWSTEDNFRL